MTLSAKQIIADRETTDESSIDAMFLAAKALNNREARLPALEDFFLSMQPRPIEEAPSLERIIAIGWQAASGNVRGYWWRREAMTDEKGIPMCHPKATHFIPLDALQLPEGE